VTIPPPSWINIAHKHHVKMLGTLIFEQWDDQNGIGRECKVFLDGKIVASLDISENERKQVGNEHYADQLVAICEHYGFEGYLMNFEVKIQDTAVLMKWLKYLREKLHEKIPGGELMWYDSVLHDGSLRWQSMLNEKNYHFLEVCDSFFTDYHWQPGHLGKTLETFMEHFPDRNTFQIYYGNDCYGRGTYGGGKYDVYKALEEIHNFPFSVAIFGQAFTWECEAGFLDQHKWQINEEKFWHGIEHAASIELLHY
jgi:mannosyl-glycoprotein endo-beta-N-acetylglucosaminidase